MNDCLLVKSIWKITQGTEELWYRLLKAKYMPEGNFFKSRYKDSFQFWKGLHKVKHLFKWGAQYKVMDGRLTSFWDDSRVRDVPLRLLYPTLYACCGDQNAMVSECFNGVNWDIDFNRSFTETEIELWHAFMNDLSQATLDSSGRGDKVSWTLQKSEIFTTKSLYRFITHGSVISKIDNSIWKCKLPLKIRVFLWQIYHGNYKIQPS